MKKAELRKLYLSKRDALTKDEVENGSRKIFENFLLNFKPLENEKAHIFLSIQKFNEVDTGYFVQYFLEEKIRVFVPKMKNGKLISVELTANTPLEINSWGISEPATNSDSGVRDFTYVITPLLCCDFKGNRVGYGKGFYDRFFKETGSATKKIGVSFFPPTDSIEDVSENDVPLDYLLTPESTVSFMGSE